MKTNPLISIVVPVYNVEQYLSDCMSSLLKQTYYNLEIILVDDGSTDKSGEICEDFAKTDERVCVVHQDNGGLSCARNTGIDMACGEYIMFVDSDDQVDIHIVEKLYEIMIKTTAEIAICDPVHVFGNTDIQYISSDEEKIYCREDAICEMWYQKCFLPSAWGKLYKTTLLKQQQFRTGILFEDIDMMHLVFWSAKRIVYNPSKLYAYQHREGSITTKKFSKSDCEILNICQRLKDFSVDKNSEIQKAAKAYSLVGALRVELNFIDGIGLQKEREKATTWIKKDALAVIRDKNVRNKTKIGLILYLYCRPLMRLVHKRVNRWK